MPPRLNQQTVKFKTYKPIAFGGNHVKKVKWFTSLVALSDQCLSSASPALTYSALLNEQHSRRKSSLVSKETVFRNFTYVKTKWQERNVYRLNSWTSISENIWVNSLFTKIGGTCRFNWKKRVHSDITLIDATGQTIFKHVHDLPSAHPNSWWGFSQCPTNEQVDWVGPYHSNDLLLDLSVKFLDPAKFYI